MMRKGYLFSIIGILLLAGSILYMGYGPEREHFNSLFLAYSLGFLGMILLYHDQRFKWTAKGILLFGLGIRLSLLFSTPGLSDDIYRFIWDGHCIHEGINPYSWLPRELLLIFPDLSEQWMPLFLQLNSPDYYSVYPPLSQALFSIATAFSEPNDLYTPVIILRFILILGEVGLLLIIPKLLAFLNLHIKRSLFYAANPLVILEVTGNLHFEGLVLTSLAFAALTAVNNKGILVKANSLFNVLLPFTFSIGFKLTPLILVPLLARRWPKVSIYKATLIFILLLLILFSPFLWTLSRDGFLQSLDLYMRHFEFNASVYYLLRWFGYVYKGYNIISQLGPFLAILSFLSLLILAFHQKSKEINCATLSMWSYIIYITCSTTVHPWYILIPLGFSLFTTWRFPIVWSWSVFLSYSAYQAMPVQEIPLATALVYAIPILYALWEWTRKRSETSVETVKP